MELEKKILEIINLTEDEDDIEKIKIPASGGTSTLSINLQGGSRSTNTRDFQLRYDDWYLETYAFTRVHMNMIEDSVRTETYKEAIEMSKHLIKDKIIMDVGCGTGILSLFAAKTGAKRVIAVESSDIADAATQVMIDNKLDHIVTVIKSRLEDLVELPHGIEKVDVIVSEFMGYSLFFESMMDTIVFARDKWLKPGGVIMPDKCSLFIFGVKDAEFKGRRIEFWNKIKIEKDVYDFGVMAFAALRRAWKRYLTLENNVVTSVNKVVDIDLNTITIPELRILICGYTLTANQSKLPVICHGIGSYFTVTFSVCHKPIIISTAPWEPATHWGQTVFFFRKDVKMLPDSKIVGQFGLRKHPRYFRDIQFTISTEYLGMNESFQEVNHYLSY